MSAVEEYNDLVESQPMNLVAGVRSTTSRDTFATLISRVRDLTPDQRRDFMKHSHSHLEEYVREFEHIAKSQAETSKTRKIAQFAKPLYTLCTVLTPSPSGPLQLDPSHSALVLGGVAYVLSISQKFLDYGAKIRDQLSSMLERLHFVEGFLDLYSDDEHIQRVAIELCSDILHFCIEASKFFLDKKGQGKSSLKLLATSTLSPFESKFGQISKTFDKRFAAFESCIELIKAEGVQMLRQDHDKRNRKEEERSRKDEEKQREERRQRIIERIPTVSFEGVQNDKLESCLQDTGDWLLKGNKIYESWFTSTKSDLLWIYGKHGCGKSHLAARVINDLSNIRASDDQASIAYIYCNALDSSNIGSEQDMRHAGILEKPTAIDLDRLLGSLLKQLLNHIPPSVSLPLLEEAFNNRVGQELSREKIRDGIKEAISKTQKSFIVVDGLDECEKLKEQVFEKFCNFIASISRDNPPESIVKVIVFSRPGYTEITSAFSSFASLQVDAGANSSDIGRFVTAKLSKLDMSNALRETVKKNLITKAEGMFLWVDLVSSSLKEEKTAKGIKRAAEELPTGLEKIYQWSLEGILKQGRSTKENAMKILLWVANAFRPLSRGELLEALAILPGMTEIGEDDRLTNDDGFITDCADLIVERDGYYQLLHSSLKEYLEELPTMDIPSLRAFVKMQSQAHEILSNSCMTYLEFEVFSCGPVLTGGEFQRLVATNTFFNYASLHWGRHVINARNQDLQKRTATFVSRDKTRDTLVQSVIRFNNYFVFPGPYIAQTTPFHLLALFDLVSVAERVFTIPEVLLLKDNTNSSPFIYATIGKSHGMCRWILDKCLEDQKLDNAVLIESLRPIIDWALRIVSTHDWGDIAKTLIQLGANKNLIDLWSPHWSPLHIAASWGSETVLRVLLGSGAEPNNTVDTYRRKIESPLTIAIRGKRHEVVDMLLRHGANPNLIENDGETALFKAIHGGNTKTAKLLVEKYGANPKDITSNGMTTLHAAALSGSNELISLLINKGVDPFAVAANGNNVAHFAVESNSVEFLEALTKNVPKLGLDHLNNDGFSPAHEAAKKGKIEALRFLLKYEPTLANVKSNNLDIPLHIAAWNGELSCVEALATPQSINQGGFEDQTPLIQSILAQHISVSQCLIGAGADIHQTDEQGSTPLSCAADLGDEEAVNLLLKSGADPNFHTETGCTPLCCAARYGNRKVVSSLLAAGADPLLPCPEEIGGGHPFAQAVQHSNSEVVDLFLELGLNGITLTDIFGDSSIHVAAEAGNCSLLKKLLVNDSSTLRTISPCTKEDVMRFASNRGWDRMICCLTQLGISPDGLSTDLGVLNPLMVSAMEGRFLCLKSLVRHGANIEAVSEKIFGRTALHWATYSGFFECASFLLKAGADPMKRDALGYSSLDYAHGQGWNFESILPCAKDYIPIDNLMRLPPICSQIIKHSSALLAIQDKFVKYELQWEYSDALYWLAQSLGMHDQAESNEDTILCFLRLLNPPDPWRFNWTFVCDVCKTDLQNCSAYRCCSCTNMFLCASCYGEFAELGKQKQQEGSLPDYKVLLKLEAQVRPVKALCEAIRHDGWLFVESFARDPTVRGWASNKLKQYYDWSKRNNSAGKFQEENFTGWRFLRLVKDSLSIRNKSLSQPSASRAKESLRIRKKLVDFYWDEGGDQEPMRPFNCAKHRFQNIPSFIDLPDGMKSNFNPDGTLSNLFLRGLCERYALTQTALSLTASTEGKDVGNNNLVGNEVIGKELVWSDTKETASTSNEEPTAVKCRGLDLQHSFYLEEMLEKFGVKEGDGVICKYQDMPSMVAEKLAWLCAELAAEESTGSIGQTTASSYTSSSTGDQASEDGNASESSEGSEDSAEASLWNRLVSISSAISTILEDHIMKES